MVEWLYKHETITNSASNSVEVEAGAELGKIKSNISLVLDLNYPKISISIQLHLKDLQATKIYFVNLYTVIFCCPTQQGLRWLLSQLVLSRKPTRPTTHAGKFDF